jgi:hypothetical protein
VLQAGARKIEVELTTISSNYHVELNPSDAGFQDRYVVQEIIKEMAKSRPLDISGNKGFKGSSSSASFGKISLCVYSVSLWYVIYSHSFAVHQCF